MRLILEPTSGGLLGPSWDPLGRLWGLSWAPLGLSCRLLGTLWDLSGRHFGVQNPSQEHMATLLFTKSAQEGSREPPGTLLGPSRDPSGDDFGTF